jgi:MFS superfamily sulfate permease-like transporter
MDYLTIFVSGIIVGLLLSIFFTYLSSGKKVVIEKGESRGKSTATVATKEDILKITNELEELKNLYKSSKDENEKIQEAEKEFYESIAGDNEQNII